MYCTKNAAYVAGLGVKRRLLQRFPESQPAKEILITGNLGTQLRIVLELLQISFSPRAVFLQFLHQVLLALDNAIYNLAERSRVLCLAYRLLVLPMLLGRCLD